MVRSPLQRPSRSSRIRSLRTVKALPSSGQRGRIARLRYRVTEKSGRSREWATIYGGGKPLGTVQGRLDEVETGVLLLLPTVASAAYGAARCHAALLREGRRSDGEPQSSELRLAADSLRREHMT